MRLSSCFRNLVCLSGLGWVAACTQHSTAPANVAFHNITARYNALLQAKEKLEEARTTLFRDRKDNYAALLPVVVPVDSNAALAVSTELAAVIKKASLVAERHQNAIYVDDAYLLIGQARLEQGDFRNAVETFKYVNTNYPDENSRSAALIGLMRAYVEQREYGTALRVADVVRTLPLSKEETREYYLTKAYLHQQRKEYAIAAAILEETLPLMKKGERRARVYYALGQLYELTNKPQKALAQYSKVQKNRPGYDLSFYAKLNSLLNQPGQDPNVSFSRMLKDRKNDDLKDRIYYAMGSYEERRGNIKQAIPYYKTAAQFAKATRDQLPAIYLRIAELSYNPLQDYESAQAYYDSTVSSQPKNMPDLPRIIEKKKVLDEFVRHLRTIRTEDSLQHLAGMNPTELDKYLAKVVSDKRKKEEDARRKAEEAAARARQEQLLAQNGVATENTASAWYFYNPSSVQRGSQEFREKWGPRKLEDNWRRSTKDMSLSSGDAPMTAVQGNKTVAGQAAGTGSAPADPEIQDLKKTIPFGQQALEASRKKQETAYFELGKLYKLGLSEPAKSKETFEKLLALFPNTSYEPETLYLLYLLAEGTGQQAEYKNRLAQKFPDSYFVRMINRSSLTPLTSGAEAEAQTLYADAYGAYTRSEYANAMVKVEQGLQKYAGNALEDKFALLHVMLVAKTQNAEAYRKALGDFLRNYPNSTLTGMAKDMQSAAKGK